METSDVIGTAVPSSENNFKKKTQSDSRQKEAKRQDVGRRWSRTRGEDASEWRGRREREREQ